MLEVVRKTLPNLEGLELELPAALMAMDSSQRVIDQVGRDVMKSIEKFGLLKRLCFVDVWQLDGERVRLFNPCDGRLADSSSVLLFHARAGDQVMTLLCQCSSLEVLTIRQVTALVVPVVPHDAVSLALRRLTITESTLNSECLPILLKTCLSLKR